MGMEARNRALPDWFTRIRTGQLTLPRFRRFEIWSHAEVITLLDSVIRGRPVGAALVLETGGREPFVSRRHLKSPFILNILSCFSCLRASCNRRFTVPMGTSSR